MNQDNPRRTNYSCSHAVKGILLIHCIASIPDTDNIMLKTRLFSQ